jgi:murein DD-endopeptidase MepM/ murein hydrolase activator NlpD
VKFMDKQISSKFVFFALIFVLILFTGCLPTNDETAAPSSPLVIMKNAVTALPVQPVQVGINTTPAPVAAQDNSSSDNSPLEFTFPTPNPPPKSLWRPPLYDAPWALGPFDHFYFTRPIAADEVNWPLANYRYGGVFFGTDVIHTGVDIDAKRGTPVLAAGPGTVVWAGYGLFLGAGNPNDPYGNAVEIKHDFGYQGRSLFTVYGHMDRVDVAYGQRVETGTQLGIVGMTGKTTGPHLHFEVRIQESSFYSTRNPELWLAPPQGWGVLVGLLRNTNGSFLTGQDVQVKWKENGQTWHVISYGGQVVKSDDYYHENLVLSDLPAGDYQITIDYLEETYSVDLKIHPGAVTYFTFHGANGYNLNPPPLPAVSNWLKY